ncbi:hypothetical protein B0H14DRAFT_2591652 [Mycena olivaceomarginata]|nr:hypothetical protein B0H14DRAFT_2591652 [Mycena olivaceomarginata]
MDVEDESIGGSKTEGIEDIVSPESAGWKDAIEQGGGHEVSQGVAEGKREETGCITKATYSLKEKRIPGAGQDLLLIHGLKCKDYGSELRPYDIVSHFNRENLEDHKLWFVGGGPQNHRARLFDSELERERDEGSKLCYRWRIPEHVSGTDRKKYEYLSIENGSTRVGSRVKLNTIYPPPPPPPPPRIWRQNLFYVYIWSSHGSIRQ